MAQPAIPWPPNGGPMPNHPNTTPPCHVPAAFGRWQPYEMETLMVMGMGMAMGLMGQGHCKMAATLQRPANPEAHERRHLHQECTWEAGKPANAAKATNHQGALLMA